jgi:hypothetical protein
MCQTPSIHIHITYLYYKEQRQLKTFLTQIGSTLPLTPDPLVICFWKWIWWKDYEVPKNHNLESVSAKNNFFSHRDLFYPPLRTRPPFPVLHHANCSPPSAVAERGKIPSFLVACCGSRQPPMPPSPLSPHRSPDLPSPLSTGGDGGSLRADGAPLLHLRRDPPTLPLPMHHRTRPPVDV